MTKQFAISGVGYKTPNANDTFYSTEEIMVGESRGDNGNAIEILVKDDEGAVIFELGFDANSACELLDALKQLLTSRE